MPHNEFPIFSHTGDVEILVKGNRYLLHRIILTQCSGFFEASIGQEWSKASNDGGRELARIGEDSRSESARRTDESGGAKKRWRYELETAADGDNVPMLVQKAITPASLFGSLPPPPVRNKPPSSNTSFFRSVANLTLSPSHTPVAPPFSHQDQDLLNDYDNLFRIFYNYPPAVDPIDIATAYLQCKSLLSLADLYDALAVVGPRIDHHLLQFQSRLWTQIAKYPSSYLKIGYLAQSKSIFQEALIHVVGAWPMGKRHIQHRLPHQVLDIIEDKVDELEDLVGKVEGRLYRLNLTTPRGERVGPHNAYVEWLAVSLFRQWLAESTAPPPPPPAPRASQSRSGHGQHGHSRSNSITATPHSNHAVQQLSPLPTSASLSSSSPPANPNLGRVFRALGTSPATYLGHDECKRFLKLTPEYFSRENLRRFEKKLEELKGMARETCRPLLRCHLFGDGAGANYLTCTRVTERDFPWNEQ